MSRAYFVGLSVLLGLFAGVSTAHAKFGIVPGSATIRSLDTGGQPDNRAGAHPDRLEVGLKFNSVGGGADGNVKDVAIELPPGLIGDPSAVPVCSREAFDGASEGEECSPESQVGSATLEIFGAEEQLTAPIFNVEAAPGEMAALGISLEKIIRLPVTMKLRSRDYGTTLGLGDLVQTLPLKGVEVELWGIPVDHQSTPAPQRHPFLTLPTRCDGEPLAITLRVRSWQAPDTWHSASSNTGFGLIGCDALSFEPSIALAISNPVADTPSGSRIDITVPQNEDSDKQANGQIRDADIMLPEGMSLSPTGAAGIEPCSDTELSVGTTEPSRCPAGSRVGTAELVSSQFRDPMMGDVYMGQEHPGERFRLFLVARGPGVEVKLVSALLADPVTGRLTVRFNELPQFSPERITLIFADGPQAPLVTPLSCGPAAVTARFDSYGGGAAVESSDTTEIGNDNGSPCLGPAPFVPTFIGGTAQLGAGKPTALSITLRRKPGEQLPDRFSTVLPPGFSAALGAVERCEPPAANAGVCPDSARIGSVVAEVGSGPEPVPLQGSIYLTGPYRGAPFGLALTFRVVFPAFDLGTITVRAKLRTDSRSARVSIETASLPRSIEGVLVRFQTIGLDIDRPGFIRNPTSCAPGSLETSIVSVSGAVSQSASPFAVRGCRSLSFHPVVSMALRGAKQLHRGGNPGMQIGLRSPKGSTNFRNIKFPFPRLLRFDSSHLEEICAREVAAAGKCPVGSQVGTALARTPLLPGQMNGSIYAVQPPGDGLPDLWTDLKGGGIRMDVQAKTMMKDGHLSARLVDIPDVPLPMFEMRLYGGSKGILVLRKGLCHRDRSRAIGSTVALEGQNRAYRFARVEVEHPPCAGMKQRRTRGGSR